MVGTGPASRAWWRRAASYDNRFRTQPASRRGRRPHLRRPRRLRHRRAPAVDAPSRRQREVAVALEAAVDARGRPADPHHRRQHLRRAARCSAIPMGATGDEDDDWFFTFFQPYRYVMNRIPVYPCIGNHDGDETEVNDDRDQIIDNFYLAERLQGEEAAGRASVGPRPLLPLPLRIADRAHRPRLLAALPALRRALLPPPEPRAVPGGGLPPAAARRARAGGSRSRTIRRIARGRMRGNSKSQPRAPRAALPARGRAAGAQRARAQLPALARGRDRLLRHRRRRARCARAARRASRRRTP